ncbi:MULTISPECIES: cellulase family glycosylhydrolase [unclassified Fusibacter]|uniref:cellulase family glycosylhydrolase n=1 Tax=unclassified Fusibacter TaxID=2624464 RepID=UPI001011A367|nr:MULTISPECIES: cellulase family glycosylhydrolase [unclassified Fusibacter]MCK8061622.1 cellulase family glycosylhydrolase [Fusibacter sp. A2]NPE23805.1 cellulase family glycosylhydrolase [Fusibacter sp. A1]RXV58643.1 hypothetical protein DWB64_18635 [Fusibacter sp. A1]
MNIKAKDKRFVDTSDRERIFHGINMVFKGKIENGKKNFIPTWDENTFKSLRALGFNLVRLGMQWQAIEPVQDVYNEEYLSWLEKMVCYCKKNDIYVYLDMHQDLFSGKFADGAPEWATLDHNLEHFSTDNWSDAYLFSDAVKGAFDNFWTNKLLDNNVGVQDQFASLWRMIAGRFSKFDNIIGFDLFNEPFPGSSSLEIFGTLLGAYAQITQEDISPEELMRLFAEDETKLELLMKIENKELYGAMADAAISSIKEFDEKILSPFYQKIRDEIRKVTDFGMIVQENNYFSNMGITSQITKLNENQQVYSPHGYDLVVDSPAVALSSNNRVSVIFDNHKLVQDRLNVPVIVGEWGAHYSYGVALNHIEFILNIFDRNKWSHTYWDYTDNQSDLPVMKVLKRAYPQAVNGDINSYSYKDNVFTMLWTEMNKLSDTIIYLPDTPKKIVIDGEYGIEVIEGGGCLCVIEPCVGCRKITITI